ncbi:MAG: DUF4129 domain-containing protein [Labilithrix sp.]|nr:DUF4129 domain-containing protein [Labilithrix sp.]
MSGFRATLRRSWPVLVSYGVFSVWGVMCLVMSLVLTSGGFGVSPGDLGVLAGVFAATLAGHIGGNLLGLSGLRLMPVVVLFFALFIGATLSGVALGAIALFLVIAVFSALGGYLGIASRLDVVAAWYPLSFCIGGAIVWMNRHGAVETFHGGSKHAVWDGFTMICLTGGVFLMLVFLATRHSLGLTVWQEVARPRGLAVQDDAVAVARPGRGSFAVLFVFTLAVLGATALISPYLFRTREPHGEHDGSGGSSSGGSSGQGASSGGGSSGQGASSSGGGSSGQGASSSGGGSSGQGASSGGGSSGGSGGQGASSGGGSGGGSGGQGASSGGGGSSSGAPPDEPLGKPDASHAGDAAGEALGLGMKLFMWLLAAVAALLVLMLVVFPPFRRAFLLRHLERPLWPVAPTARVMNLWRRALAVLAVLDIEPSAGETPSDFARRAESELQATLHCDAVGLRDAAAIVEKIDYAGRGLGAGEEQTMREAITAFVQTVERRVGFKKKLAAAWGRAPEVES